MLRPPRGPFLLEGGAGSTQTASLCFCSPSASPGMGPGPARRPSPSGFGRARTQPTEETEVRRGSLPSKAEQALTTILPPKFGGPDVETPPSAIRNRLPPSSPTHSSQPGPFIRRGGPGPRPPEPWPGTAHESTRAPPTPLFSARGSSVAFLLPPGAGAQRRWENRRAGPGVPQ